MFEKTTEYAIRSLVYIFIQNQEGKRPGFKEIAEKINSPVQFTAKVLQNLAHGKLISSIKGRGGGFFFDQPAIPLTIFEVIRVIEGDEFFSKCGFGLKHCDCEYPCPMHDNYSIMREGFFQLVKKETIQSLAAKIIKHKAILTRL